MLAFSKVAVSRQFAADQKKKKCGYGKAFSSLQSGANLSSTVQLPHLGSDRLQLFLVKVGLPCLWPFQWFVLEEIFRKRCPFSTLWVSQDLGA